MHRPTTGLYLLLCLAGCVHPPTVPEPYSPPQRAHAKTQVFVLGMIHSQHRTSKLWGLEQVRSTIRAIHPDVICPEIPPANWPSTLATWKAKHVVEDSRVQVFPEYVDALLPLTDTMDFVVEPSAGWTAWMAEARNQRLQKFATSDADAEANAAYTADENWVQSWFDLHPAPAPDDNPFFIHSPLYDLRTKIELGPYEYHLNEVIGRPGGWTYINEAHFNLIQKAIRKHPGERILVTFGSGHKYWFMEQLRWMPDVELMDVRPFLPNASAHPRTKFQVASEEFLRGVDSLRVWWAQSRGDSLFAWQRIKNMLDLPKQEALLNTLQKSKGNEASEFHDGPFLGAVELVRQAPGSWQLRMEVRRLQDTPQQATWIEATLVADSARLGGFAWTSLQIPTWLLEPAKISAQ